MTQNRIETGQTTVSLNIGDGLVSSTDIELHEVYREFVPSLVLALAQTLIESGVINRVKFLENLGEATINAGFAPDDVKEDMFNQTALINLTVKYMNDAEKILYGLEKEGE